MKHVVILGAGVAGLEAALALRDLAKDAVSVEVVSHESECVRIEPPGQAPEGTYAS